MPIVEALGNDKLEQIHWDELRILLNIEPEFPIEEK
jgi:hypothetical protein